MAFRVELSPEAFEDLDAIASYIKKQSSSEIAQRWFNGVMDAIASLKQMPARCPVAPESEDVGREVRVLVHGRKTRAYKIYYAISYETSSSGVVQVFHVRHWARKPISDDELQELLDDSAAEESE